MPARELVVALHVTGVGSRYVPVVQALQRGVPGARIVAGGPATGRSVLAQLVDDLGVVEVGELLRRASGGGRAHVLLVGEPVLVPAAAVVPALATMDDDDRIGTVSFLSNAASFASFPFPNQPLPIPVAGHDADTITATLRSSTTASTLVPIAHATGGAVLVSASTQALLAATPDDRPAGFSAFVASLSADVARHGLGSYLDPTTYVLHPGDLAEPGEAGGLEGEAAAWFPDRYPAAAALAAEEQAESESPLGRALAVARTKLCGLRLLVDGSALGPIETGAQVGLVAMVAHLAERADVREVVVTLPGELPGYAGALLDRPGVRLEHAGAGSPLEGLGRFDVAFLPRQPDEGDDLARLGAGADRVVVTVLDLIAYRIGDYHQTPSTWLQRRAALRERLRAADGVVAISADVARSLVVDRVPAEPDRVFTVPFGVSHLSSEAELHRPEQLPVAFAEGGFLLCLGTNYAHKNRDLALRTHAELMARGRDLPLVLAGPLVAAGSSRVAEAMLEVGAPELTASVHRLADVSPQERNWLLHHAAVVLYPTSAEGFGLVPFEAAALGTPSLFVPFGPLVDWATALAVVAQDWSPEAWADAIVELLDEPTAEAQVEQLCKVAAGLGWDATAAGLVEVFRAVLAGPRRTDPGPALALVAARAELVAVEAERDDLVAQLAALRGSRSFRWASRLAAVHHALRGGPA